MYKDHKNEKINVLTFIFNNKMLTGNKNVDFKILAQLDDKSLVNYCSANKKANEICKDQIFWMNRILLKFPYLDIQLLRGYKGDKEWSEYYINELNRINPKNAQDKLYHNSQNGRLDLVMVAVNNGADIRAEDDVAVRLASGNVHLDVVKYLVSLGAPDPRR